MMHLLGFGSAEVGPRAANEFENKTAAAPGLRTIGWVCRHISMAKLDGLVIENVKERLFTPERLTTILESLLERKLAKNRAVEDRRAALLTELAATNEKLNRLYRAIEDGIVDLDAQLKERVNALKTEHDLAQASLDRIAAQANTRAMITPDRLAAFSPLMREKLDTGDTQARKAYLQSVISEIEVDDNKRSGSSAIRLRWPPSSRVAKPARAEFAVLYANGAASTAVIRVGTVAPPSACAGHAGAAASTGSEPCEERRAIYDPRWSHFGIIANKSCLNLFHQLQRDDRRDVDLDDGSGIVQAAGAGVSAPIGPFAGRVIAALENAVEQADAEGRPTAGSITMLIEPLGGFLHSEWA